MVSDDSDRGQLVLVGAIVVAVAIVGLVVVLNSVLFTENVTNRTALESTGDAQEIRQVVRDDLPGLLRGVNRNGTYGTPEAVRDATNRSVREYGSLLALSVARRRPASVAASVADRPSVAEAVVHDDASRAFTDRTGASEWTVVEDGTVQRFRLTVDASTLAGTEASAFRVNVSSGGESWTLLVYRDGGEDGGGDENAVTVTRAGSGVPESACTVSPTDGNVTVRLANGTVASGACSFAFAAGVPAPYDIAYGNATNATGTYRLVLDGTGATLGAVDTDAPWRSPHRDYVVEAASVSLTYATPELTYETTTNATLSNP